MKKILIVLIAIIAISTQTFGMVYKIQEGQTLSDVIRASGYSEEELVAMNNGDYFPQYSVLSGNNREIKAGDKILYVDVTDKLFAIGYLKGKIFFSEDKRVIRNCQDLQAKLETMSPLEVIKFLKGQANQGGVQ